MTDTTIPPDTLLVDGNDINSLCILPPDALAGVLAPGTRRGGNLVAAGLQGQRKGTPKPLDAFPFTIPVTVVHTTGTDVRTKRASVLSNFSALVAAVAGLTTNGAVLLCRRLSTSGGHVDQYAQGEFVGATSPTWLDVAENLSVNLQFINLSGAWTPTLGDVANPLASTWVIP
jgi:hypothetical protein